MNQIIFYCKVFIFITSLIVFTSSPNNELFAKSPYEGINNYSPLEIIAKAHRNRRTGDLHLAIIFYEKTILALNEQREKLVQTAERELRDNNSSLNQITQYQALQNNQKHRKEAHYWIAYCNKELGFLGRALIELENVVDPRYYEKNQNENQRGREWKIEDVNGHFLKLEINYKILSEQFSNSGAYYDNSTLTEEEQRIAFLDSLEKFHKSFGNFFKISNHDTDPYYINIRGHSHYLLALIKSLDLKDIDFSGTTIRELRNALNDFSEQYEDVEQHLKQAIGYEFKPALCHIMLATHYLTWVEKLKQLKLELAGRQERIQQDIATSSENDDTSELVDELNQVINLYKEIKPDIEQNLPSQVKIEKERAELIDLGVYRRYNTLSQKHPLEIDWFNTDSF